MNKLFAVLKREYLQAVRKKSFIIMTLIFPFLMVALMVVPALVMTKGMGMKKIAVLDGTGKLQEAFAKPNEREKVDPKEQARKTLEGNRRSEEFLTQVAIEYKAIQGDLKSASKPYFERMTRDKDAADRLDGVFVIPAQALTSEESQLSYYSRASTELIMQERLARMANKAMQRLRLQDNGMQPDLVEGLLRDVPVESVQLSRTGEQKKGGELNFLVAFIFGALLILPSFIYGQETMRGIVQEKTDRVVEVLLSSMSSRELLAGKILGVAAVGLTQITVWLTMIGLAGLYAMGPLAAVMAEDVNMSQFIRPSFFFFFVLFFVLAYLTYVCVYAIAGAACNSDKEAQQFVAPIVIFMMLPWILMMPIVMNPESPVAVGFSLAPVFGPITMFVRTMVSEPPVWHVVLSIAISIVTILAFLWTTAKIFRVGILSHGKRPTIPELWKWTKVA